MNLVVRTHDCRALSVNGVHVRPEIQLVSRSVVRITGHGLTVELLFVEDVVLDSGLNTNALDTFNGLCNHDTSKIWIGAETLPVTTTLGNFAQATSDWSKHNVSACPTELLAYVLATLTDEIQIPC